MRLPIRWSAFLILSARSFWSPLSAQAQEKYYIMLFAAEGKPNLPRSAHSFATFIKVQEKNKVEPAKWPIEIHTISWLPATLDVRLLFQPPEQGKNLDLPTTLKFEASMNADVSAWGPFQIQKNLYERALTQIKRLNSGEVAYKALDRGVRPKLGSNCFHAISDIVDGPLLDTGTAYGVTASQMVLQHLAPEFVAPIKPDRDLAKRIVRQADAVTFRDDVPTIEKRGYVSIVAAT